MTTWPRTPAIRFAEATSYYRRPSWTKQRLASKRFRLVIRLVALETVCQEQDIGALPAHVMLTLKLLSDYRGAGTSPKNYTGRKITRPEKEV